MRLNLLSGDFNTYLTDWSKRRVVNFYPSVDPTKQKFVLLPTPGTKSYSSQSGSEVRGCIEHNDVGYFVVDNTWYSIGSDKTTTNLGTIATERGRVDFAASNTEVMLVDGGAGYLYDTTTSTFSTISDADFPSAPVHVDHQDGYFIVTTGNASAWYLSAISDGSSWGALDFGSKSGQGDPIQRAVSHNRELWLFGKRTTEVWYNSGASFPFERRSDVFLQMGTPARWSIAKHRDVLLFLGQDMTGALQIYRTDGYNAVPVANEAIAQRINRYSKVSDAFAYVYADLGHSFYVITFPEEEETLVFDLRTNSWFELQSFDGQGFSRHISNCYMYVNNAHVVGAYDSGDLLEFDEDTYTDNSQVLRRSFKTGVFAIEDRQHSLYNLWIQTESGTGAQSGQGSSPVMMLRYSNDGGHNFSPEYQVTLDAVGEYGKRTARFSRLGTAYDRVIEVAISDPIECAIYDMTADIDIDQL